MRKLKPDQTVGGKELSKHLGNFLQCLMVIEFYALPFQ